MAGEDHIGGDGSVVWGVSHRGAANTRFRPRNTPGPPARDEVRFEDALLQIGRDTVDVADISQDAIGGPAQQHVIRGYFTVRLRLPEKLAGEIRAWVAGNGPQPNEVNWIKEGPHDILMINVPAISRAWPNDDQTWADMPWEVRTNW